MEAAFGADFSSVAVHQGAEASAIGASAFASGDQLAFRPGRYDASETVAHEAAHVVQQRAGLFAGQY
jgi:hypothetical protein